ncbi:RagB/SusD family nutrient uptake outer membrane protein [Chryseobacterium arthrosphaerae]|uniref:RagB/SusD family nutrient uptake outer membrane protein n=1 Tax=Chryseobacterium arthrosphaerae TaxID=651561 RepID=UPI001F4AF6C8|nr:RagB/SusD family nutrient uptake outer membrane protein [Chryseobacterium arthrosphaerae]MDG4653415.1 RagB/SusD family nutrient uptake outer membrane protein [Chryseobacterium arthrosphaerae]
MKRIINTVLVLATLSATGFALNSCQDALDIKQAGELQPEEVFTNVSNLNEALNGSVYAQLDPIDEIYFTAVFTDEVKPGSGSGGQDYELHRFFLDPSTQAVGGGSISTVSTNGIWLNNYRVINRVNRLLEGAKNITPNTAAETTQYNSILAQARAIRAFCYIQLETYFSPDMKDPNALGVVLIKDIPSTDAKLPRAKNQEVYDFINADLDYARGILGYSTAEASRYTVGKAFVNALSARFNLYRGNTVLAKQYAQEVINNSPVLDTATGSKLTIAKPSSILINPQDPSLGFQPIGNAAWNSAFYGTASSFNPYRNLWNDSSKGEIIFSLNRLPLGAGASIGVRWNTNQSTISGVPMWFLGRNLFNIVNSTTGDIRRYNYIDPTSVIKPNYLDLPSKDDRLVIDKYPGKTSAATRNDLKVFRLSEMYFILAEAEVAAGNLTAAHDLIQQVRVARNYLGTATTPTYTSAQFAYADILKERRVELGLEGHRYIDLKRLATIAGVTMDRNIKDDFITLPELNLPNDSYKYTLPIPVKETSANPNIQQNPGY